MEELPFFFNILMDLSMENEIHHEQIVPLMQDWNVSKTSLIKVSLFLAKSDAVKNRTSFFGFFPFFGTEAFRISPHDQVSYIKVSNLSKISYLKWVFAILLLKIRLSFICKETLLVICRSCIKGAKNNRVKMCPCNLFLFQPV